jgi:CheY-like chemotaxis protein
MPQHRPRPVSRWIAWVGDSTRAELAWARTAAAAIAPVHDADSEPPLGSPTITLVATDRPGRFHLATAAAIARRWPLTVLVAVATSLADGRRRSGPPLPGIEEVPWCDLPSRLRWWLAELDAGRPGMLGLPATTRREDRVFEAAIQTRSRRPDPPLRHRVALAARHTTDLEGLAGLVTAVGHEVAAGCARRPPMDLDADVLLWDVEALDARSLEWLRLFTAHRPRLPVVLLDSFPHHDSAAAAFAAGAKAVLSRPLSLEALAGTLLAPQAAAGTVFPSGTVFPTGTGVGSPSGPG